MPNNKKVKPGYKAKVKREEKAKQAEKRPYFASKNKVKPSSFSQKPKPTAKEKKAKKQEVSQGASNAREVAKIIQWFPGHMTKAFREIQESIKLVDIVLELCDARIPQSSRNPKIAEIVGNKPLITIMNKCSLSDPEQNEKWKKRFIDDGKKVIFTDCITGAGIDEIVPAIRSALREKIQANQNKGMFVLPRVMIIGVTNCGKSTLINRLYGSKKAKSENRPGVTRIQQWVRVEDKVELLDTPGVLWPKFDDEKVGLNLAYTGAIRDEILDIESIAVLLCSKLMNDYESLMFSRYKLSREDVTDKKPHEIFEAIGRKRGFLISGGDIDYLRTARILLDEFRGGTIGRITLDKI